MSKPARTLICQTTGLEFTYSGRGRPPKYHPSVRGEVVKGQRKAARQKKKGK